MWSHLTLLEKCGAGTPYPSRAPEYKFNQYINEIEFNVHVGFNLSDMLDIDLI